MHAQTGTDIKIRIDEATVRSRKFDSIRPPSPDAYRITEIHGALVSRSTRLLKTTIGIRTIERSRRLCFFRDFLDFVKRINEHVSITRLNFQILIRRLLDNDTANDAAVLQMHGLYILGDAAPCKAAENEKQKQLFHKTKCFVTVSTPLRWVSKWNKMKSVESKSFIYREALECPT